MKRQGCPVISAEHGRPDPCMHRLFTACFVMAAAFSIGKKKRKKLVNCGQIVGLYNTGGGGSAQVGNTVCLWRRLAFICFSHPNFTLTLNTLLNCTVESAILYCNCVLLPL